MQNTIDSTSTPNLLEIFAGATRGADSVLSGDLATSADSIITPASCSDSNIIAVCSDASGMESPCEDSTGPAHLAASPCDDSFNAAFAACADAL